MCRIIFTRIMLIVLLIPQLAFGDVVYNRDIEEQLNPYMLVQIFTKKQKFWADGAKIVVFIKPINSIEHKYFVSVWLGIPLSRFKTMLESEIYAGTATVVNEVKSDGEMMVQITSTPNSIGYIDGKVYKNTGDRNVKVYSNL